MKIENDEQRTKMELKRNVVENTNDCSIVSKYSMCRRGYACDKYLKYFIDKHNHTRTRSPLINRGYYIRHQAIHYALSRYHSLHFVISIGCGFDTSSLRLPNIYFIEIDLPFVALTKANFLIDNHLVEPNQYNCKPHIDSNEPFVVLRTNNYCLIGADLRKYEAIGQLFTKENLLEGVNKETRIGLLNECSLCYLKQDISDRVIKVFVHLYNHLCHSITYIGYEQLNSHSTHTGFSSVMLNHFQTIGSPLITFLTKSQLIHRFKVLGFDSVEVLDMKTFYDDYIDLSEKQRIDGLELFDEFEEFDLVCNCYALTIAQTNSKRITPQITEFEDKCLISCHQIKPLSKSINESPLLSRFGHTTCLTRDNEIVLFGGFGCGSNNKQQSHRRLSNVIKINTETDELINYTACDKLNADERIHSKIVELEENLFLISGGRRSPSVVMENKLIRLMDDNRYEAESIVQCGNIAPKVYRHFSTKLINTNQIIELGGRQSSVASEANDYYILDTNTMQWQRRVVRDLCSNVYSHSGTALDSHVFVVNGGLTCDTNSNTSSDIYMIDERMDSLNRIRIKNLDSLYSHNIKSIRENQILIIGGISKSGSNNKIDLIDIRSNEIVSRNSVISESALLLHNFSSELVNSNDSQLLWLIGGGGNCFSFGTHFNNLSVLKLF